MISLRNMAKRLVLFYLKIGAKIQLWKVRPKIIGVGGASGKTSTAGFIEAILSEKYKVRATHGKNSETGIPLSILGISLQDYSYLTWFRVILMVPLKLLFDFEKYDCLVAEMGIDGPKAPKNMEYLLGIISPRTAVLTNITHEHSLNFETEENKDVLPFIAEEELKLLESLPAQGKAITNGDDLLIGRDLKNIKAEKITVSAKKPADFKIEEVSISQNSFVVKFSQAGEKFTLKINQALPSYFAYSLIFSVAACFTEGISVKDSIKLLEKNFTLPAGRSSIFRGIKNTTIIDSSYNSSLEPSLGMLDLLKILGGGKRKVAIVGDMRELGKISKKLHEELAQKIIQTADFCILIGPQTAEFVAPFLKQNDSPFAPFKNFTELKHRLLSMIEEKDFILVKGSQNTLLLERVVELLLKDKNDVKFLARRGEYWDRIRASTP
ncbi:MAG: Mur ligase family protein [Patescibacteria group bacterium]